MTSPSLSHSPTLSLLLSLVRHGYGVIWCSSGFQLVICLTLFDGISYIYQTHTYTNTRTHTNIVSFVGRCSSDRLIIGLAQQTNFLFISNLVGIFFLVFLAFFQILFIFASAAFWHFIHITNIYIDAYIFIKLLSLAHSILRRIQLFQNISKLIELYIQTYICTYIYMYVYVCLNIFFLRLCCCCGYKKLLNRHLMCCHAHIYSCLLG